MPSSRVGWQPSRFLADRGEAERAFQLAEQLGSVNAAAAELDDDQLAALRRLRAAFGPIEVVEVLSHDLVVSHDPEDDRGEGAEGSLARGRGWRTRGG
jgi:hypothetical protein